MPRFLRPDVFVEGIPSGARSIEAVGTSIAAFVGFTAKGPNGVPTLLSRFDDYVSEYGGIRDTGRSRIGDRTAMAVSAFFQNGGTRAYVVRMANDVAEAGGHIGSAPADLPDFRAALTTLETIRDIHMLLLPDHAWDAAGKPFLEAAISHAEKVGNRMVLIDPPPHTELKTGENVTDLALPTSSHAVCYYPWVRLTNPFYDAQENPGVEPTVLAPPGGYGAGVWSRIDSRRGVWKAPAGLEATLSGLVDLEFQVGDAEQDLLNPLGVNAYRTLAGTGPVIWGSRTLATQADPEWRYVPVRRTALFIEQSVSNGIEWAVFEPNDQKLWAALRRDVGNFMNGLFRAGAFQGAKASDAYFARCGLGDTMSQADIDNGRIIVLVGFAPLKPAEFVILRIQLTIR